MKKALLRERTACGRGGLCNEAAEAERNISRRMLASTEREFQLVLCACFAMVKSRTSSSCTETKFHFPIAFGATLI
jgi:hypothetical protein